MKDMIARLHVTLLDVDPAIWRRIEVPAGFTLKALHDALQRAMGWFDGHLHHFEIGGILYGEPSPDDAEFDQRRLQLRPERFEGNHRRNRYERIILFVETFSDIYLKARKIASDVLAAAYG